MKANKQANFSIFFFNVRLLSATTSSWWIYADVLADFSSSLYCLSRRPFWWLEPRGSTAVAAIKVLSAEHFRHVSYQRDCAKPCSLFLGLRRTFLRLFVSLFSLAFNRRVTWIFRPFSILTLGQIFGQQVRPGVWYWAGRALPTDGHSISHSVDQDPIGAQRTERPLRRRRENTGANFEMRRRRVSLVISRIKRSICVLPRTFVCNAASLSVDYI